jgi:uncharacterized protein
MTRPCPVESRRKFLWQTAAFTGALAGPLEALATRTGAASGRRGPGPDYGPLQRVVDETTGLPLLMLPRGFEYVSFGWTGDRLADGTPTPPAHDGMAAFPYQGALTRIVRNHEVGPGPDAFSPVAYDPKAGGGTTTLEFDARRGRLVSSRASISGTIRNCAGGPTPWASWLTCEETIEGPGPQNSLTKPHGYVFEVPVVGDAAPAPVVGMGRFVHEAVAVDPATGYVYETEDAGITSGFYRFLPARPGHLGAGGTLQMLALAGLPQADMTIHQPPGPRSVVWVDIAEPNPPYPGINSVFVQGFAAGGARFARLEGAWYGQRRIYFTSTSGGNVGRGQVWEYDPAAATVRLVFESPDASVLDAPDNICVSPRGGLVLCEDGGNGTEFLHGLTREGVIFKFCENNVILNGERNGIVGDFRSAEFAGATYSPDGQWLFVNVQSPGITFAIRGPWGDGAL